MLEAISRTYSPTLAVILAVVLSGCAVGRAVVEIPPPAMPSINGRAFAKIVSVEDARRFEASPSDAGTPSLQNASEITDKSITARALARKRGGMGLALGDILLPPGQSVAGLVQSAARKALAESGYAVVDVTSPNYATATPLAIEVREFWSWFSPGFASVRIDFKASLNLRGAALLGQEVVPVESHVSHEGMAIFERDWADLVQKGVADLSDRIERRVRPAPDRRRTAS